MLLLWVGGMVSGGGVAIAQTSSAPSVTPAPASPQPAAKPKPSSPQQRSPQTPSPQTPEAQKLTEQAQEQYAEGAFAAALKTLETLLAMQKQPVEQAETLNLIGLVYDRLGQFDAAVRSYQQALNAYNKLQRDQPQIAKRGEARTLNNLGALYAAADRGPEALGI
ncbi:MAG: tetratricopeptide repeat protein, partial [Synechococcales cyanobacterium RU_4_20]|nr:tetratricopeptide repeat protein [Synechococcales cyanobacterium RU_4_20]